jgi:hypothetical protein
MSKLVRDDRFNAVENRLEKMKTRADEFCQTRSNFQIEKFIACDEYTPITQFRHVSHNSYVTLQEVRRTLIERERLNRKIEQLEIDIADSADPKIDNKDLDLYEANRQLDDIEIRVKGLLKEIDYMEAICDELEKKEIEETGSGFTAEKYQEREPEYWQLRLANQMHRSQIGMQTGVGEGNYMSMLNACASPILENSNNKIEKISMDLNDLAATALFPREGLRQQFLQQKTDAPEITS